MESRSLHEILRRIVLTSLATPLVVPLMACGGRTDTIDPQVTHDGGDDDAAAHDAAVVHPIDASPPPPICDALNKPTNGGGGGCGYSLQLVAGSAACGYPNGGTPPADLCNYLCGGATPYCYLGADSPSTPTYVECGQGCVGRKPAGMRWNGPKRSDDVGAHFANAAQLEAASVHAFRTLRAELEAHGAPARLLRAAERAERDEVRHTRVTSALARRFGGKPLAPQVDARPIRSLEEIARENAVEGCVRETYGALLGHWQALAAEDPVVRTAMQRIAADETRHAALAWEVAAWANARLTPDERSRVDAARAEESRRLRAEVMHEPPAELVRIGGVPSAARAAILVDALNLALAS